MNNLITLLTNVIKAKFLPLLAKIRFYLSWDNIRNKFVVGLYAWLTGIFDFRPKNKDDYYSIWGWLVGKRFVHAVIISIGLVSLVYITCINPIYDFSQLTGEDGTYLYSSIPLRFAKGNVKIKAKSGYIAYEGEVHDGYVAGTGTLYDDARDKVYSGEFDRNMYNGQGTLYYPTGQIRYQGGFKDNLYEGEGIEFRENGTKLFDGNFAMGCREGEGTLFDSYGKPVYTGSFHQDEVVYANLLNKSAQELADSYQGSSIIYVNDEQTVVLMPDIKALYLTSSQEDSLEDTVKAERIYVCKNQFPYGTERIADIAVLRENLGEPVFEGNSYITFPETVASVWLQKSGNVLDIGASMETSQDYDELVTVNSYAQNVMVYLYVFQVDELTYTFVAQDRNGGFFMYEIE